jgi:hypothetical protein
VPVSFVVTEFLPQTKLSRDLEKWQKVTAETQSHNREPNNGRGDGHGFNADPFPHI